MTDPKLVLYTSKSELIWFYVSVYVTKKKRKMQALGALEIESELKCGPKVVTKWYERRDLQDSKYD